MTPVTPEKHFNQSASGQETMAGEPQRATENPLPQPQAIPPASALSVFGTLATPVPGPGQNSFPQSIAYARQMDEFALQNRLTGTPFATNQSQAGASNHWSALTASPTFSGQPVEKGASAPPTGAEKHIWNPFNFMRPGPPANKTVQKAASSPTTGKQKDDILPSLGQTSPHTTASNSVYEIPPGQRIANGYRDDGRVVPPNQPNSPGRETIAVNRNRDTVLHFTIADAVQRFGHLPEEQRAIAVAKYVDDIFSRAGNDEQIEAATRNFPQRTMPLGEIINTGAGVSRHRALLYKVLADEVGLNTSLVKGNFQGTHVQSQGYTWNVVNFSNGQQMLVDTTARRYLPVRDAWAKRYLDFNNKPLY